MTLIAIKESLDIWVDRLQGKERENNCPLCKIYFKKEGGFCYGCPILEKTGQHGCKGTTYYEKNDEKRNLGMVKLLASLLPDTEPMAKVGRELSGVRVSEIGNWNDGDIWVCHDEEKVYTNSDLNKAFNNGKRVSRINAEKAKQDELNAAYENGAASVKRTNYDELNKEKIKGRKEVSEAKQDELNAAYANGRITLANEIKLLLKNGGM